jgi:hypothetical protein
MTALRGFVAAAAVAAAALLAACGTVNFEGGRPFDAALLDTALKAGVSTRAEVVAALGEPAGRGGAQLPFHDAPRIAWTYFWERGSLDMGRGSMNDERVYCFVFFDGDRLDGYLWFTSRLAPTNK